MLRIFPLSLSQIFFHEKYFIFAAVNMRRASTTSGKKKSEQKSQVLMTSIQLFYVKIKLIPI